MYLRSNDILIPEAALLTDKIFSIGNAIVCPISIFLNGPLILIPILIIYYLILIIMLQR
nr:MAG TPA: hypothetical protein [Caudoviricetes sp.]